MSGAVCVIAPVEQIARMHRIGKAAVWIEVIVVDHLVDAPEGAPVVVMGDPERPADPGVSHVIRAATPDDQLQALLTALATGSALAPPNPPTAPQNADEARRAQLAFTASRKLASATDLRSTETIAVEAIAEMLDAERVQCLYYDADQGALWSETKQRAAGDDRTAIAGMVGWSARTGLPCMAAIAMDDPRYVGALDDPEGDPASPILVQPILGADARVHAVLVAARRPRRPPLGAGEAMMLARFASLAAPLLDHLSIHVEGQQLLEPATEQDPLFRAEATAAQATNQWGDVVRIMPGWLSWAYWLLVLVLAGSIVFVSIGTVSTYSMGPAVIRSSARTSVATRSAGNIGAVEVAPGETVTPGTVIARLDDVDQRSAVQRVQQEFDTQLRNHMLDPSDAAADTSVRTLRLQLEQARTALEERAIKTQSGGVVSDLRVRPGQHVEPGDIAASIVDGKGGLEMIALLPGEDRPQLAAGMPLRLELLGYRYVYQSLAIESVSSDVIAPSEAKRVLGAEVADSLQLAGPVVVVRGKLAGSEFEVDGRKFYYHDGMLGTAEVPVRSERILVALIPGLRRL
jgi:membrane fusion protein (multidrug efflux system)